MFGEARLVVDVGRHQVELVLLGKQPQQDDHRPAAALPHTIVNHLAGEWDHLQIHTHTRAHPWEKMDYTTRRASLHVLNVTVLRQEMLLEVYLHWSLLNY